MSRPRVLFSLSRAQQVGTLGNVLFCQRRQMRKFRGHLTTWIARRAARAVAFSALGICLGIGGAYPALSARFVGESPAATPRAAKDALAPLVVPTQFPTIQAAVNAAHTGDTIRILDGTYVEQVTINKDLRLLGSGADSTIIRAPASMTAGSFGRLVIVDIKNGAKVTMSNLTVTGPGSGSCGSGSLYAGILVVEGATLKLSSAAITHIHDTPIAD